MKELTLKMSFLLYRDTFGDELIKYVVPTWILPELVLVN